MRPFSGNNWTGGDHPAERKKNKNTASRSLFPLREQELSRARMTGSACACDAKKLRVRDDQRCHRIVRLSPCFCAHWPLCRPKDATKLNKSLHCTVDGADRSLAISRENKKETARFAGERASGTILRGSSPKTATTRTVGGSFNLGSGVAVEHFACCDVLTEGDDVRSLISASRYLGTESLGKSNNRSLQSIACPESGGYYARPHTFYAMRARFARQADAGACRLLGEGGRK